MRNKEKITILYPLCLSHSGSTLFSLLLGCQENIFGGGELFLFSDRPKHIIQKKEENCSCNNQKKEACPFWSKVNDYLQTNFQINLDQLNVESKDPQELKLHNEYLFEAIAAISKCNIIVDASKIVSRFVQLRDAGFNLVPIVFKRNPRATVFSWTKRNYDWWQVAKYYPDYYQEVAKNIPDRNNITVAYESFVENPQKSLKQVLDYLKLENEKMVLEWSIEDIHILKGNAVRFQKDSKLKISTVYKSKLNLWQKMVISLKAFPCTIDTYWFYYFWTRFLRLFIWKK